jgi:hypothetical protein
MTTEVVPSNEFTVDFNEDKSLVTINFQGLQKSRLDALEVQVDEIAADLADAIITAGGNTSTVASDLAALTGVVAALAVDVAAEPPIRSAADVATNLAIVALGNDTDAAIATEAATRLAADNAEVVARDAAIAAALVPVVADLDAVEATVVGHTASISAIGASQSAVLAAQAALELEVDTLDANVDAVVVSLAETNAAILAEVAARSAADSLNANSYFPRGW